MKRLTGSISGVQTSLIFAVAAVACLTAPQVLAGRIPADHIPAGTKWVLHVDVDGIRSLDVVKKAKEKYCTDKCQAKMKEMSAKLGMNPLTDLNSVTIFSGQYKGEVGVGLFHVARADQEKLVAALKKKHPETKSTKFGKRVLYTWTAKMHGEKVDITGTFASDQLLVMGSGMKEVKAALDVIDGKKPSLKRNSKLLAEISGDALFASNAIDVPADYMKNTRCPVLRVCKAASARWSVRGDTLFGNYVLTAKDVETAKNMEQALEGLKAIAKLRMGSVKEACKLLDNLKFKAEKDEFRVRFAASFEDIKEAMVAMRGKYGHWKKKHGGCEQDTEVLCPCGDKCPCEEQCICGDDCPCPKCDDISPEKGDSKKDGPQFDWEDFWKPEI